MFKNLTVGILTVASLAGLLSAQTKTDINQIKTAVGLPTVWVSVPGDNRLVPAILGNGLTLVNNNGVFTITVAVSSTNSTSVREDFTKVGPPSQGLTFSTTGKVNGGKVNLMVFRNGIYQQENEDYSAVLNSDGSATVTFNAVMAAGDSVKLRYNI